MLSEPVTRDTGCGGVILRGGAVLRRGCAILVPGNGGNGSSHLVAALVRGGAELIADGEVRLDARGRVQVPDAVPAAASVAADGVDIALIVAATYREGARWRPKVLHGARAALPVLDCAASSGGSPRRLLHLAARLAPCVTTLSGPRPEADQVAPEVLAYVDDLIDGRAPGRVGDEAAQVVERAAAMASATAGSITGAASPEVERALLLQQPSIVLLHWHGRFGNRLHQYAYGVTYARRNGCRFWLPSHWEGTHLFQTQHHAVLPQGDCGRP